MATRDHDMIDLFGYYVSERQRMWHSRNVLGHVAPWTEDEILAVGEFANVYRHLDRGSVYAQSLVKHWDVVRREVLAQKLFKLVVYRFFNRIDVLMEIEPFLDLWDLSASNIEIEREVMYSIESRRRLGLGLYEHVYSTPPFTVSNPASEAGLCIAAMNVMYMLAFNLLVTIVPANGGLVQVGADTVAEGIRRMYSVAQIGRDIGFNVALDMVQAGMIPASCVEIVLSDSVIDGLTLMGLEISAESLDWLYNSQVQLFGNDMPWADNRVLSVFDIQHAVGEFARYVRALGDGHFRIWEPSIL